MKRTHTVLVVVTVVILSLAAVAVGLLVRRNRAEAPGGGTSSAVTADPVTIQPTMVSVAEDSYLFGIGGSYPSFPQASREFNQKIAAAVTGMVADFKQAANDDYQARIKLDPKFQDEFVKGDFYTYQVKADVVQSNDRFVSVVIHLGGYTGGAHPFNDVITFNDDVRAGKEIASVTDLYPGQPDPLSWVSDKARVELSKRLAEAAGEETLDDNVKRMLDDGTDPSTPENFRNFTFTDAAVTLYFGEYQVAPYVFGEQTVTLDR